MKYSASFAATVRCYATVHVEVEDTDDHEAALAVAHEKFKEAAANFDPASFEDDNGVWVTNFVPDWSLLDEVEYLEDCGVDQVD